MTKNDRMHQTTYVFAYNKDGQLVGRAQRDGLLTDFTPGTLAATGLEAILSDLQDAHDQLVKAHLEAELTKVSDVVGAVSPK